MYFSFLLSGSPPNDTILNYDRDITCSCVSYELPSNWKWCRPIFLKTFETVPKNPCKFPEDTWAAFRTESCGEAKKNSLGMRAFTLNESFPTDGARFQNKYRVLLEKAEKKNWVRRNIYSLLPFCVTLWQFVLSSSDATRQGHRKTTPLASHNSFRNVHVMLFVVLWIPLAAQTGFGPQAALAVLV